jgi:CRISPR/Cas system CSM-associated protein Csm2 small subunit
MAKKKRTEVSLEEEIEQLRELLRKASEKMSADPKPEDWLAVLDSVAKAAPQLARLLKVQRELESEDLDPVEVLREALAELEEEWPELHECKEKLRGKESTSEKSTHAEFAEPRRENLN